MPDKISPITTLPILAHRDVGEEELCFAWAEGWRYTGQGYTNGELILGEGKVPLPFEIPSQAGPWRGLLTMYPSTTFRKIFLTPDLSSGRREQWRVHE